MSEKRRRRLFFRLSWLITLILIACRSGDPGASDKAGAPEARDPGVSQAAATPDAVPAATFDTTPLPGQISIDPPAAAGAMAPGVTTASGSVIATWLESVPSSRPGGESSQDPGQEADKRHLLRMARYDGEAWSAPVTIVESRTIFANWADIPSLVARGQELVAHWAEMSEDAGDNVYAYDVILARSQDLGATWQRLGKAHGDGTASEHGFVSLMVDGDRIRAFWLDGRETARPATGTPGAKPAEASAAAPASGGHHGAGPGAMTLRTGLVHTDGEADRSAAPGKAGNAVVATTDGALVDDRVCDCCGTTAAMTATGPIVAYRDRSPAEIRDISVARPSPAPASGSAAGSWTSQPLHEDGWRIAGCPVNGPRMATDGSRVAVAWFTIEGNQPRVRVAFSKDSGTSFEPAINVDGNDDSNGEKGASPGQQVQRVPLGRVDVVLDGDQAVVVWMASGPGGAQILARRLARGGARGDEVTLARTGAGRGSGFPRIARLGSDLVALWTETGKATRVRALRVPLASIPSVIPAVIPAVGGAR